MSAKTRLTYQGRVVDELTFEILTAANLLLSLPRFGGEREPVTLVQGSYNGGGVAASAGTHDGGGAIDITAFNWKNRVRVFRMLGVAMWHRPALRGVWAEHIHGIVIDGVELSRGAALQVQAYLAGRNGLANNGRDTDWRPTNPKIVFQHGGRKGDWVSTGGVYGYRQPNRTPAQRVPNLSRKKGYRVNDSIAIVRSGGYEWIVGRNGVFWNKAMFSAPKAAAPKAIAQKATYTVTASTLLGLAAPGHGNRQVASALRGATITGTHYAMVAGEKWVRNTAGHWWKADYLRLKTSTVDKVLRITTYNLPGPDKRAAGKRARTGAALLARTKFDVAGLQELVGPGKDSMTNKPSKWAGQIHTALGRHYSMVVPTTAFNENYLVYDNRAIAYVARYSDRKIYATVDGRSIPGRHVTRSVHRDRVSGEVFAVGVTHLVNDDPVGAQAQAELVMDAMLEVSRRHGNCPIVILGDMNTSKVLKAFADGGLQRTREAAKKSSTRNVPTYAPWSAKKMGGDPDWVIDQHYVDEDWTVNGYTVFLGYEENGRWPAERPSDHVPVIASVTMS